MRAARHCEACGGAISCAPRASARMRTDPCLFYLRAMCVGALKGALDNDIGAVACRSTEACEAVTPVGGYMLKQHILKD